MKKFLLILLVVILGVPMTFIGAGCKATAATETTASAETTAATETTASAETTAAATTAAAERVTLIWNSYGEEEGAGWDAFAKETIKLYMEKHPNVEIIYQPQQAAYLWQVFATALKSGEGMDIQSGWDGVWTMQWVFEDGALPIGDYLDAKVWDKVLYKDNYLWEGKYWCMPLFLNSAVYWVNKKIWREAGLDPENLPKTPEDYMSALEAVKKTGHDPIVSGNLEGWQSVNWGNDILDMNYSTLGEAMELYVNLNKDFSDPKYSQGLSYFRQLVEKGYFNKDVTSLGYYEGWDKFKNGGGATVLALAGWANNFAKGLGEENVGIFPYWPNPGTGKYAKQFMGGAQPLFITKWCKHPKEAADFVTFLVSTERSSAMYKSSGLIPANSEFDTSMLAKLQKEIFDNLMKNGKPTITNFTPAYALTAGAMGALSDLFIPNIPVKNIIANYEKIYKQAPIQTPKNYENYVKWYEGYKAAGK